jgi:hypothetical protein
MNTRHRQWFLLAILVGGVTVSATAAQTLPLQPHPVSPDERSQSHAHVPPPVGTLGEAQQLLDQRLRRARDVAELQKALQDPELQKRLRDLASDPDFLKKNQEFLEKNKDLIDQLGKKGQPDVNDPRWRDLARRFLEQQGNRPPAEGGLSPEQLKALEDALKRFGPGPNPGNGRPPGNDGLPNDNANPNGPPRPPMPPTPDENHPGPPNPPLPDRPLPTPAQEEQAAKFEKRLHDAADRFARFDPTLKQSDAFKKLTQDLNHTFTPHGDSLDPLAKGKGAMDQLDPLGKSLQLDKLTKNVPKLDKSWLPSLSGKWQPKLPSIDEPKGPSLPSAGTVAEGGNGLGLFLTVALVVVLAVVALRLLWWNRERLARLREARGVLGPWPVDPAAVRTRDELVRAFEYLSLLLLGPDARHWHHLEIAGRLGSRGRTPEAPRAAEELAGLYEHARYAPPDEALPDAELAAARRDLCLLAGAGAA